MPQIISLRAELLRAAIRAIGTDSICWPLIVRVKACDGSALTLHAFNEKEWLELSVDIPDDPEELSELSELEEDALEAADRQWRTSADLAARTGVEYTGHWRGAVASLIRRDLLERQKGTRKLRRTETSHERPADLPED